jgi:hypothetical protein
LSANRIEIPLAKAGGFSRTDCDPQTMDHGRPLAQHSNTQPVRIG